MSGLDAGLRQFDLAQLGGDTAAGLVAHDRGGIGAAFFDSAVAWSGTPGGVDALPEERAHRNADLNLWRPAMAGPRAGWLGMGQALGAPRRPL